MTDGYRVHRIGTGTPLDYEAPDGSKIRLLSQGFCSSLCHCTLQPGHHSGAVSYRTVEELWYFLSGRGLVWREQGLADNVADVGPGTSLVIPPGVSFQFYNSSVDEPLCFLIMTCPPWPGADEARLKRGYWPRPTCQDEAGHKHVVGPTGPDVAETPSHESDALDGTQKYVDSIRNGDLELPNGYSLPGHSGHEMHDTFTSVREAEHQGKSIRVETTYRVTIDDEPLTVHTSVLDDGSVHYHGLPNHSFASALDMARKVVETSQFTPPEDELAASLDETQNNDAATEQREHDHDGDSA